MQQQGQCNIKNQPYMLKSSSQISENQELNWSTKLIKEGTNVLDILDFFKAYVGLCYEGKNMFSSMFGGVINIIVIIIVLCIVGHPFKQSYMSSINLVDNIIYNYTGQKNPIGIKIKLPQDYPHFYNNLTVNFFCRYNVGEKIYFQQIKKNSIPCQLGQYCVPRDLQCPIYSFLNQDQVSLIISVAACESIINPNCNITYVNTINQLNISLSYYSDEISFSQPKFNKKLITRNISIPLMHTAAIYQNLQINFFNTNSYFKGLFGFGTKKLVSLHNGQTHSTKMQMRIGFFGLFQGDSIFNYQLSLTQKSKRIIHNFPSINSWIAEVTSLISLIILFCGYFLRYYEQNMLAIGLVKYLRYSHEDDKSITNFNENNLKTVIAGLLFRQWWIKHIYPENILIYFKIHFKAFQYGYQILDIQNFFKRLRYVAQDEIQTIKIDLDRQQPQQQDDKSNPIKFKQVKKLMQQQMKNETCITELQKQIFLTFIKINNLSFETSKRVYQSIFNTQKRELKQNQYELVIKKYNDFKLSGYNWPDSLPFNNNQQEINTPTFPQSAVELNSIQIENK